MHLADRSTVICDVCRTGGVLVRGAWKLGLCWLSAIESAVSDQVSVGLHHVLPAVESAVSDQLSVRVHHASCHQVSQLGSKYMNCARTTGSFTRACKRLSAVGVCQLRRRRVQSTHSVPGYSRELNDSSCRASLKQPRDHVWVWG